MTGAFYEISQDDGDTGENTVAELKVPVYKLSKSAVFQNDDINLPFVNDEEALGRWEMIDIVPSEEQFLYGKAKCSHRAWLYELCFLEGGEPYWAVLGWTKGFLYTGGNYPQQILKNRYTIKKQNGHNLMFLEMKHYMDGKGTSSGAPEIWVYEKTSDAVMHASDIKKRDRIDYPFITDEKIIGAWRVRDFVIEAEKFEPLKQSMPQDKLYFWRAEFLPDGKFIQTTEKDISRLSWTKGLILYNAY